MDLWDIDVALSRLPAQEAVLFPGKSIQSFVSSVRYWTAQPARASLSVWAEGFEEACKLFSLQRYERVPEGHEDLEDCVLKAVIHAQHVTSLMVCGEGNCEADLSIVSEMNLSFFTHLRVLEVKRCSVDRLVCPSSLATLRLAGGSSVSSHSASPALRAGSVHLSGWVGGSEARRVVGTADFERLANAIDTVDIHSLAVTHFREESHGVFATALLSRPLHQRDSWQSLRVVRLTNTNLDCIPSSLNAARGLTDLDLSDNALRTVDLCGLVACESLTSLSLARNRIVGFSTGLCPSLRSLVLHGNELAGLDSITASANEGLLESLTLLDLSFNSVARWTELCNVAASLVARCPQFSSIRFDGNPLCHKLPEADPRVFVSVAALCSSGQVSSLEVDGVRVAVAEPEWCEIIRSVRDGLDVCPGNVGVRTVAVQTPHRRPLKMAQDRNPVFSEPAVETTQPEASRHPRSPELPAVRSASPPALECLRRSFPRLELGCVVATENFNSDVMSKTWEIAANATSNKTPTEAWLGRALTTCPVLDDYAGHFLVRVDEQATHEGSLFTVRQKRCPSATETSMCGFGSPLLSSFVGCARAPTHMPNIAVECIPLPSWVGTDDSRQIRVMLDVSGIISGSVNRTASPDGAFRGGFVCPSEEEASWVVEVLRSSFEAVSGISKCLYLQWPLRELLQRHRNWGGREMVAPAAEYEHSGCSALVHCATLATSPFWAIVSADNGELRLGACEGLPEGTTLAVDETTPCGLSPLGGTIATEHGPVTIFAASSASAARLRDQLSTPTAATGPICSKVCALALFGIGATAEQAIESLNEVWACVSVSSFGGIVITSTDAEGDTAPIDVSGVESATMRSLFASKHPLLQLRFCRGECSEFLALRFASPEGCVLIADYLAETDGAAQLQA